MAFREDIASLVAENSYGALGDGGGWPRLPLGEIARIINGFAFQSSFFTSDQGIPLVRIRDVVDGASETRYFGPVPSGYDVEDGDLLVGMDGDFNCAFWRGGSALLNQRVCKIVPDDNRLRPRFLGYALPAYLKLINEHTSSVTVKHLSSRTLEAIPFPLPRLGVQDAIVARLDELFAEIEDGERALDAAHECLAIYRKALLKAAVKGELTSAWRTGSTTAETGHDLLRVLLAERRRQWELHARSKAKRYVEPRACNSADLPDLPEGWCWASLEQLSSFVTSGSRGWADYYSKTGALFIRAANLNRDRLDLTNVAFVTVPNGSEGARTQVANGDVLITITGANVTKAGRVEGDLGEAYVSQHVGLVRPVLMEMSEFLYTWIIADGGGRGPLEAAAYGAGKPGLNLQNLLELPVALPPLAEQAELVARIAAMAIHDNDLTTSSDPNMLCQSILAAAFRGDLVA